MADQDVLTLRDRIIGVLLKDARLEKKKSKRECGELLGVSSSTITAFEEGRKSISLPELEALAFFLDVPLAHFWNEEARLFSERSLPPIEEILEVRHRLIGALLRQARLEADLSQKDLAEVLDCSPGQISSYELGDRPIPLAELEVLASELNRPIDYFLDQQVGTIGQWEKEQEMLQTLRELPPEIRNFIARPINRSYLEVAMKLAEMPAGGLRTIAEGLLEITY